MLRKYKILVIDDDIGHDASRKSVYDKLVADDFLVQFIQNEKEIAAIEDILADGYIIDANLSRWPSVRSFDKILPRIRGRGPVFLVSSKWMDYDYKMLMELLNATVENPVKSFFALNEFFDKTSGTSPIEEVFTTIRMKILTDLNSYYRRSPFAPAADEALNILHISDTQFGDPAIERGSSLAEKAIAQFLRKNRTQPHFLIVSGDIAYSGKPSEYDNALDWFKGLLEELWPGKDFRDHILVVPGNHDVSYGICAADQFVYNSKTKQFDRRSEESISRDHCKFALSPFAEFAHRLTGGDEWLRYPNGSSWVNEKFLNIGLRFFHLNSLSEVDSKNYDRIRIEVPVLKNLSRTDNDKNVFNIAISHHGMGVDTIKGYENWEDIRNFNNINNVKLFVYGHGHAWAAVPDPKDNPSAPRMYMIMAPTTHLNGSRRTDPRGFNLITLQRKKGHIEKVVSQPYEMRDASIMKRIDHETGRDHKLEWKVKDKAMVVKC